MCRTARNARAFALRTWKPSCSTSVLRPFPMPNRHGAPLQEPIARSLHGEGGSGQAASGLPFLSLWSVIFLCCFEESKEPKMTKNAESHCQSHLEGHVPGVAAPTDSTEPTVHCTRRQQTLELWSHGRLEHRGGRGFNSKRCRELGAWTGLLRMISTSSCDIPQGLKAPSP